MTRPRRASVYQPSHKHKVLVVLLLTLTVMISWQALKLKRRHVALVNIDSVDPFFVDRSKAINSSAPPTHYDEPIRKHMAIVRVNELDTMVLVQDRRVVAYEFSNASDSDSDDKRYRLLSRLKSYLTAPKSLASLPRNVGSVAEAHTFVRDASGLHQSFLIEKVAWLQERKKAFEAEHGPDGIPAATERDYHRFIQGVLPENPVVLAYHMSIDYVETHLTQLFEDYSSHLCVAIYAPVRKSSKVQVVDRLYSLLSKTSRPSLNRRRTVIVYTRAHKGTSYPVNTMRQLLMETCDLDVNIVADSFGPEVPCTGKGCFGLQEIATESPHIEELNAGTIILSPGEVMGFRSQWHSAELFQSEMILVLDADFRPSVEMESTLRLWSEFMLAHSSVAAFVVPAIECDERVAVEDVLSFDDLAKMIPSGQCQSAKKNVFEPAHKSTMVERWSRSLGLPLSLSVRTSSWDYEPYVVVSRRCTPAFDERFQYYGYDNVQYIRHLKFLNSLFFVLPSAFVIHKPHSPRSWSGKQERDANVASVHALMRSFEEAMISSEDFERVSECYVHPLSETGVEDAESVTDSLPLHRVHWSRQYELPTEHLAWVTIHAFPQLRQFFESNLSDEEQRQLAAVFKSMQDPRTNERLKGLDF